MIRRPNGIESRSGADACARTCEAKRIGANSAAQAKPVLPGDAAQNELVDRMICLQLRRHSRLWCGVNLGIANGQSCVNHSSSKNEVALKTTPRWIGFFVGNLPSDLLK